MSGDDRIVTIPNAVTVVRLACVPVFVVVLVEPHRSGRLAAAVLLAVLGATDWVDGQLARRLGQVSTVGKVLDPFADRVLLATAAVSIVVIGAVPVWVAVLALGREAAVALGFLYVAAAGGARMDVSRPGKAATLCLMTALPLFLVGHAAVGWHGGAEVAAWVFVVPALVLGYGAAAGYVRPARRALAAARGAGA